MRRRSRIAQLAQLAELKQLKRLSLTKTQISDDHLEYLEGLKQLKLLFCARREAAMNQLDNPTRQKASHQAGTRTLHIRVTVKESTSFTRWQRPGGRAFALTAELGIAGFFLALVEEMLGMGFHPAVGQQFFQSCRVRGRDCRKRRSTSVR